MTRGLGFCSKRLPRRRLVLVLWAATVAAALVGAAGASLAGCGTSGSAISSAADPSALDVTSAGEQASLPSLDSGVPSGYVLEVTHWVARPTGRELASRQWTDFEEQRMRSDWYGDPTPVLNGPTTTAVDPTTATILYADVVSDGESMSYDARSAELRLGPANGRELSQGSGFGGGGEDVVLLGRQSLGGEDVRVYRVDLNIAAGQERSADFGLVYVAADTGLRLREEWLLGSPGNARVAHLFEYDLVPRTAALEGGMKRQALIDLAADTLAERMRQVAVLGFPVWGLPEGSHGLVLSGATMVQSERGMSVSLSYVPQGEPGVPLLSVETTDLRGRNDFPPDLLITREKAIAGYSGGEVLDFGMTGPGPEDPDTAVRAMRWPDTGRGAEASPLPVVAEELVDVRGGPGGAAFSGTDQAGDPAGESPPATGAERATGAEGASGAAADTPDATAGADPTPNSTLPESPSPSEVAVEAETFTVTRVTDSNFPWGCEPQVSGDRLVWCAQDGNDTEIYTWTPDGGTVKLTSNKRDDGHARVSGDRVVWYGSDGSDFEIYTWTPVGGTMRITSNDYSDVNPEVSGDRIVWQATVDGSGLDLFTWTPTAGVVRITKGVYCESPKVSDDRVAWIENGEAGVSIPYGIFTWTPADSIIQLTKGLPSEGRIDLSGNRIVWADTAGGSDSEIFSWTPADGIVQVTANSRADTHPVVSGDRIAWTGSDGATLAEVYTWIPGSRAVQITSNTREDFWPAVSGNRVVWVAGDGNDHEIYSWTPDAGIVQVTSNTFDDDGSMVSGDRIVWDADDGGGVEIWSAVVSPQ